MSDHDSPVGSPAKDNNEEDREVDAGMDSDRDSDVLSEIDENQFDDYDPETANIEDRPVDIDEDIARTLKVSKRKRIEGQQPKKPREGRREKKRRDRDEDVGMEDGSDGGGADKPARRRRAAGGERAPRAPAAKAASPEPINEDHLSPEEKRKLAIDRALDAAMKKPSGGPKRRRKDEIVSLPKSST